MMQCRSRKAASNLLLQFLYAKEMALITMKFIVSRIQLWVSITDSLRMRNPSLTKLRVRKLTCPMLTWSMQMNKFLKRGRMPQLSLLTSRLSHWSTYAEMAPVTHSILEKQNNRGIFWLKMTTQTFLHKAHPDPL